MNFCWDPGIFTVLGIKFSTDVKQITSINCEGKLTEINRILNTGNKRQITPLGKITVIKTLALSRLIYLFVSFPDPPDDFLHELSTLLFHFLWDGKQSTIGRKIVCQSYEDGGLGMVDVFTVLSCMKIGWLRRLKLEDSSFGDTVFKLPPDLNKLKLFGGEFANVPMQRICNPFWKDVLKHYKKLYTKCLPENIHDFVSECIHYNINITINKKVVYIKDWFEAGIIFVHHLMDNNGNYLTFKTFKQLFLNVRTKKIDM